MKNSISVLLIFLTFYTYGQNNLTETRLDSISYERKIAKQTCIYLSEMDSISDPKQAIINCVIKAKNKIHDDDADNVYKRDYTVDGVRGLHKKVTDLLIENCEIVSISN